MVVKMQLATARRKDPMHLYYIQILELDALLTSHVGDIYYQWKTTLEVFNFIILGIYWWYRLNNLYRLI